MTTRPGQPARPTAPEVISVLMGGSSTATQTRILYRDSGGDGIEIRQTGNRRSLWFGDDVLQTEIDLQRPEHLPHSANRAMLAHLMFTPTPTSVLLAGAGGGGIGRWFNARSPDMNGVAVEISAEIAGLARTWFEFPEIGQGWELITADVRDYLRQPEPRFDFILFDLAEAGYSPPWLTADPLIKRVRRRLTTQGVATFNLLPRDGAELMGMLARIRRHFDRRTLCLSVPEHDNIIAMAFNAQPDLTGLDERVGRLEACWGIEFSGLLARLREENPVGSGVF